MNNGRVALDIFLIRILEEIESLGSVSMKENKEAYNSRNRLGVAFRSSMTRTLVVYIGIGEDGATSITRAASGTAASNGTRASGGTRDRLDRRSLVEATNSGSRSTGIESRGTL